MFGTIRKHQRWLWAVIIAAVIASFVMCFSPNQLGDRRGRGDATIGRLDGRPVGEHQLQDAHRQAELRGFLRFGENYKSLRAEQIGFNVKQEATQRLFLGTRLKASGIRASHAVIATWIAEYLKDPKTGVVNFDAFPQNVLKPANSTEGRFCDFVRHEVGMQELERLIGAGGPLVASREAEVEIEQINQQSGADTFRDPAGAPHPKEVALAGIREVAVRQWAAQLAGSKADEFPHELYQMEPVTPANLARLAQKRDPPRILKNKFSPI